MKNFILKNWYKLMIGSSLFFASFGFMVYALAPANAKSTNNETTHSNYKMVPINTDGTISVKLTDEQLNKIIPKNVDGSINIRLSEEQLKIIVAKEIQPVNIVQVAGYDADVARTDNDYPYKYSLGVKVK